MEIIYIEQGTPEWLKLRIGVVTASAVDDICKPSTIMKHVYRLAAEIATGKSEPMVCTAPMQFGIDNEEEARDWYVKETGREVEEVGFIFKEDDRRAGCSPDGLVGEHGMIEIKVPNSGTHQKYIDTGRIPLRYKRQMQTQMWASGRAWCDFVTYDPRVKPEFEHLRASIQRVPRDPVMILTIEQNVAKVIKLVDEMLAKKGDKEP